MSDEKLSNECDVNPPAEEAVDESVMDVAENHNVAGDNHVVEETAIQESDSDVSDLAPSEIEGLKLMLTPLGKKLDSLTEKFDTLIQNVDFGTKFAEKKQEQIDKLYEENRKYKDELIEKFKEKLVMGIIEQLSQADRQVQNFAKKEESEKNYRSLLEAFRELTGFCIF